jgi:HEPN domain-containing protein
MLSDHAVRTRYPGEEPTVDEAREALRTARAVRRFARQLLGVR